MVALCGRQGGNHEADGRREPARGESLNRDPVGSTRRNVTVVPSPVMPAPMMVMPMSVLPSPMTVVPMVVAPAPATVNRDRGESRDSSPPTPPYVRITYTAVRQIKRYDGLQQKAGRAWRRRYLAEPW